MLFRLFLKASRIDGCSGLSIFLKKYLESPEMRSNNPFKAFDVVDVDVGVVK